MSVPDGITLDRHPKAGTNGFKPEYIALHGVSRRGPQVLPLIRMVDAGRSIMCQHPVQGCQRWVTVQGASQIPTAQAVGEDNQHNHQVDILSQHINRPYLIQSPHAQPLHLIRITANIGARPRLLSPYVCISPKGHPHPSPALPQSLVAIALPLPKRGSSSAVPSQVGLSVRKSGTLSPEIASTGWSSTQILSGADRQWECIMGPPHP